MIHFLKLNWTLRLLGVGLLLASASPQSESKRETAHEVSAEMRNVMYHFTDSIGVHIFELSGKLVPTKEIPVFDDKQSFVMQIDSATMSISTDALTHVLNDYVFAAKDAPLKALSVSTDGDQLKIKGKLAHKADVSFEMVGDIQATPEGKIRVHARHVKAAHLPVKGLLDLFGVKLADLINTKKINGVTTEKDDIILDPEQILPPPLIRGKLTSVKIENGQIVQVFGSGSVQKHLSNARNFMAYRGGVLQFGKLTMHDTDLVLIDSDSKGPFDFYLDHYREQLTAGYTKTTPQFGLRVYMVDYDKLQQKTASAQTATQAAQMRH